MISFDKVIKVKQVQNFANSEGKEFSRVKWVNMTFSNEMHVTCNHLTGGIETLEILFKTNQESQDLKTGPKILILDPFWHLFITTKLLKKFCSDF